MICLQGQHVTELKAEVLQQLARQKQMEEAQQQQVVELKGQVAKLTAQLQRQSAEAAVQMQQLVQAELVKAQKLPKPRPGNKGSSGSDSDELVLTW